MRYLRIALALIASLAVALAVAVAGVWLLGDAGMRRPDADPDRLRTGALFSLLRDGECFALEQAYPQPWETALFVPGGDGLTRMEQGELYAYDASFLAADEPMLLLWDGARLVEAIPMPDDIGGYPRFVDAMGGRTFELKREEALFECTFRDDGLGYYECRQAGGEQA